MSMRCVSFFFFFQAEDGIRDVAVTGVQTCALPIYFTNLQRQVTFGTSDVGKPKSQAARARLSNLNPDIQIDAIEAQLTSANALELFKDYDIIVDGTDNFPTRYLVNEIGRAHV